MKIETVLKVLEDEKRLHKMFAVDEAPEIYARRSFDMGLSHNDEPLEEFDSIKQSFETLDGKDKFTVFAKDDSQLEMRWGWIRHYVKTQNGNWFRIREDDADLPDEVADNMVKFGEIMFSHGEFVARKAERFDYEEELDEVDEWAMQERWDNEKGDYVSRLSEEAEYKGWPFYTSKYDSYFPNFA